LVEFFQLIGITEGYGRPHVHRCAWLERRTQAVDRLSTGQNRWKMKTTDDRPESFDTDTIWTSGRLSVDRYMESVDHKLVSANLYWFQVSILNRISIRIWVFFYWLFL